MEKNWLIRNGWTFETKDGRIEFYKDGKPSIDTDNKKERYELVKFLYTFGFGEVEEWVVEDALKDLVFAFVGKVLEEDLSWIVEINLEKGSVVLKKENVSDEIEFDFMEDKYRVFGGFGDLEVGVVEKLFGELVGQR